MAATVPHEFPPLSLEYYFVGFFDLLGQQEHLRRITGLPDKNNPAAMEAMRNNLRDTYGAVMAMRRWFADAFETFERKPRADVPAELREVYREMNNNPIEFKGISDSMVVFVSLKHNDGAKLPARAALGLIYASALTYLGCLSAGHPIRGGIDLGVGFKTPEGDIYGPVLSRAYSLESNVANYPRIVVGEELVTYLNTIAASASPDPFAQASKSIAEDCFKCLAEDDDGQVFVDYLGELFREMVPTTVGTELVHEAYGKVIGFSEKCKVEGNSKLAFRFTLLRNYFEDRLPLWPKEDTK